MTDKKAGEGEGSSAASPDYKVGYGQPPKHSQFRKGQSGNPRGRPKRRQAEATDIAAIIHEALDQKVTLTSNGRSKVVRRRVAFVMSAIDRGIRGTRDARLVFDLLRHFPPPPSEASSVHDGAELERKIEEMVRRSAASQGLPPS